MQNAPAAAPAEIDLNAFERPEEECRAA